MADQTLTLDNIAGQIHVQFERLMMLQELTQLTIKNLPNSTDSDVPLALLTGIFEIVSRDAPKMYALWQRLENSDTLPA